MKKRTLALAMGMTMLTSVFTPVYADNIDMTNIMRDTATLGYSEIIDGGWYEWNASAGILTLEGEFTNSQFRELTKKIGEKNISKIIIQLGSKITDSCQYLFYKCENLAEIEGLSNLDTSSVSDMMNMFLNCKSLTSLDLSELDLRSVNRVDFMFENCEKLESIDLSGLYSNQLVGTMYMFYNTPSLTSITLSAGFNVSGGMGLVNKSDEYAGWAKQGTTKIISGDGEYTNFAAPEAGTYIRMLASEYKTVSITSSANGSVSADNELVHSGDTVTLTVTPDIGCALSSLTVTDENGTAVPVDNYTFTMPDSNVTVTAEFEAPTWYEWNASAGILTLKGEFTNSQFTELKGNIGESSIIKIIVQQGSKTDSYEYMFYNCKNLEEIEGLSNLDLNSEVTVANYMFANCEKLESLDLSGLDKSKISNEFHMFNNTPSLKSLTLPARFNVYIGMGLANKSDEYAGWAKEGTTDIISGNYDNANFVAPVAGNYYRVPYDLSDAVITFDHMHSAYTGDDITPVITVKIGNMILTEGTDYTVSGETTAAEPGNHTITIQGMGRFTESTNAVWVIDPVRTYTVEVTNGTIKGFDSTTGVFDEKQTVTVVGSTITGGWYNNGRLVSAEKNYSFYVFENMSLEWIADDTQAAEKAAVGIANVNISDRVYNAGTGKTTVTVTSTWKLPAGAVITKAGTYRCYVEAGSATPSQTELCSGTFKQSKLTTTSGTFYFNINMGAASSAKKLCAMTYVEYTLDGDTITVMSDVMTSEP